MGKTEGQIAVDNQLGHAPAVVWLGPRAPCQWARCCVSPTAKIRLSILASWEHPVDHADHQGPGARDSAIPVQGNRRQRKAFMQCRKRGSDAGLSKR